MKLFATTQMTFPDFLRFLSFERGFSFFFLIQISNLFFPQMRLNISTGSVIHGFDRVFELLTNSLIVPDYSKTHLHYDRIVLSERFGKQSIRFVLLFSFSSTENSLFLPCIILVFEKTREREKKIRFTWHGDGEQSTDKQQSKKFVLIKNSSFNPMGYVSVNAFRTSSFPHFPFYFSFLFFPFFFFFTILLSPIFFKRFFVFYGQPLAFSK